LLRCARNDGEALCRPVEHYDIEGTRLMRTRKPITPGDPQAGAETFAKFDCSPRVSAVPRVLDREDAALDVLLRQAVQEALDDPRPAVPADEVFAALRAHHAERMKAAKRDA
jgi:antitoxin ParD1/3/4